MMLSDVLKVGDLIYVHDNCTYMLTLVTVLSNASGVVDVSDGQQYQSQTQTNK